MKTSRHCFYHLILAVTLVASLFVSLTPSLTYGREDIQRLDWDDLMPAHFSDDELFAGYDVEDYLDTDVEGQKRFEAFKKKLQSAPVVETLNGKLVSLPGFAIPLEGDSETTRLFLLVPYFGACIHVPPPPSNQIVLVSAVPGVQVDRLFAPVNVTGRLLVESANTDLADAGYKLHLTAIEEIEDF